MTFCKRYLTLIGAALITILAVVSCGDDGPLSPVPSTWELPVSSWWLSTCTGIAEASNGDLAVLGSCNWTYYRHNAAIVKVSAGGDFLWHKRTDWDFDCQANAVAAVANDAFVAGGYMRDSYDTGDDVLLFKVDNSGNILWRKRHGGGGDEVMHDIAVAPNGDLLLACDYRPTSSTIPDGYLIIRTNSSGDLLWQTSIPGGDNSTVKGIVCCEDGSIIFTGRKECPLSKCTVAKLSAQGNLLWQHEYGESFQGSMGMDIAASPDNSLIVVGKCNHLNTSGSSHLYLLKIDSEGNVLWERVYDRSSADCGYSVVVDQDGSITVAGQTLDDDHKLDMWLVRTTADGAVQWDRTFGSEEDDIAFSLVQCQNGGYALAGSCHYGWEFSDSHIIKTDASGQLVDETSGWTPPSLPWP